ncbi:hypothetical protein C4D60_Mb04t01120 [Musa balbisiana]|uniref:Uncharacterized protein n=1 Tax=Musa balbisiana TaxID=52838 RepID=A0A4S8K8W6_MUSBA|nr:hypothetical protein C4D60_Mb04t01120 [Musa balbisiana]
MEFVKALELWKMQISMDSQVQLAKIKRIRCNSEERHRIIFNSSCELIISILIPILFRPTSVSSIKPIRIETYGAALGLPPSTNPPICSTGTHAGPSGGSHDEILFTR